MSRVLTFEQRERKNAYRRVWRQSPAQKVKAREDSKKFRARRPDYQKKWREAHPKARRYENYFRLYGLTKEAFDVLLASQGGRCGVCRTPLAAGDKKTHVDHDHSSNRVRGILCQTCNVGIGMLGDSFEGLTAAVDYLRRSKA